MSLISYRPNSALSNWLNDFENFFDSAWNKNATNELNRISPLVDIVEEENQYDIKVELPGVDKKDVKLHIENDVLSISGEKKLEAKKEKDGRYRYFERSFGSFERSFRLPENIDANSVDAHYANGVLSITLKKKPESKPRQIEVKVH